jgi:hypothetical protein
MIRHSNAGQHNDQYKSGSAAYQHKFFNFDGDQAIDQLVPDIA